MFMSVPEDSRPYSETDPSQAQLIQLIEKARHLLPPPVSMPLPLPECDEDVAENTDFLKNEIAFARYQIGKCVVHVSELTIVPGVNELVIAAVTTEADTNTELVRTEEVSIETEALESTYSESVKPARASRTTGLDASPDKIVDNFKEMIANASLERALGLHHFTSEACARFTNLLNQCTPENSVPY